MPGEMRPVKDHDDLRAILADGYQYRFRMLLNGGAYSAKILVLLEDGKLDIFNEIDGSFQTLSFKQLDNENKTLIGAAIKQGAFILESRYG